MGLDKEKERIRKKRYRDANKEKLREYNRTRRPNRRASQRFHLYGLTEDQFRKMVDSNNGACDICNKVPNGIHGLHIDHHHESGKVRGLLCAGCNRSLAALDNKLWLKKAMAYLEENS